MTLLDKEIRHKWLMSQYEWHSNRVGKWHKSQARYYKKLSNSIFTFYEMMCLTMRAHAHAVAANVSASNSLLSRLTTMQAKNG